jgi:hypothetical protein
MIDFTIDGQAIVSFDIRGSTRERLELPLSDYLVPTKSATTLEEFRVLLFTHVDRQERAQAAAGAL